MPKCPECYEMIHTTIIRDRVKVDEAMEDSQTMECPYCKELILVKASVKFTLRRMK